ncbi:MAG: hypothetical protein CMJ85_03740, partial [Planctomycetes bacterium]|nr:hypothetical protein [Planctomycetota bacterium]
MAPTEVPEELSGQDWSSIRAAYEAGRNAVRKVDGVYQAHNPGQRWRTRFVDGGFLVTPDTGSWTWGLALERYGFAGHEQDVRKPKEVHADAGRVSYHWDAILEEWYVNDQRGLEHGY